MHTRLADNVVRKILFSCSAGRLAVPHISMANAKGRYRYPLWESESSMWARYTEVQSGHWGEKSGACSPKVTAFSVNCWDSGSITCGTVAVLIGSNDDHTCVEELQSRVSDVSKERCALGNVEERRFRGQITAFLPFLAISLEVQFHRFHLPYVHAVISDT